MKNVIDLTRRLNKDKAARKAKGSKETAAPVIDMTEKRNEIISQERRQVKRTILSEFIGAFAVVPRKGLLKVSLYDISDAGMAFDVEMGAGHFAVGEEIAMRVYLNQQTYFPLTVKVQNIRAIDDESAFRHGANFTKETLSQEPLFHFVKFIESVSASLQSDAGDIQVSTIAR
jgi:hypothetical protein